MPEDPIKKRIKKSIPEVTLATIFMDEKEASSTEEVSQMALALAKKIYNCLSVVPVYHRETMILTFTSHILLSAPKQMRDLWMHELEQSAQEIASAVGEADESSEENM